MDARELLEQVLESGKRLSERPRDSASRDNHSSKDDRPTDDQAQNVGLAGPRLKRDQMMSAAGAGAAAAGILTLLLHSRQARKGTPSMANFGSAATLGGLGYKFYSEYQKSRGDAVERSMEEHLAQTRTNARCLTIVQAMIAAAKADGVIDEQERKIIEQRIRESELEPAVIDTLLEEIAKPLIVSDIARLARTPIDGVDIYLASLLVVDPPNSTEAVYLGELSSALDLDPTLVQQINSDAFKPI